MKLDKWLDDALANDHVVFAKRLSGNDTLATKSHQAGPYLPKDAVTVIAPELLRERSLNPRKTFKVYPDSHPSSPREVSLIWYNNRVVERKTRDECRLTGWGGRASAVLDPESTGTIAILFFAQPGAVRVWVCRSIEEEDLVEARLGPVEPGHGRLLVPMRKGAPPTPVRSIEPPDEDIDFPAAWEKSFPTGAEIAALAASKVPRVSAPSLDHRLTRRRKLESDLFRRLEEIHTQPLLPTLKTFTEFRAAAMSLLQRAKSRSGGSLELHVQQILDEERIPYSRPGTSEGKKKPDFILPSNSVYADPNFPSEQLRMLAAKTSLKDRWRQVLNEADRVKRKHLITLAEGVSEEQFREMAQADLQLIVPFQLHKGYPKAVRPSLITLDTFVVECRALGWKTTKTSLLFPSDADQN